MDFTGPAEPGRFRLLIREYKYRSANYVASEQSDASAAQRRVNPGRLNYAETMAVDDALVGGPSAWTGTTAEG